MNEVIDLRQPKGSCANCTEDFRHCPHHFKDWEIEKMLNNTMSVCMCKRQRRLIE